MDNGWIATIVVAFFALIAPFIATWQNNRRTDLVASRLKEDNEATRKQVAEAARLLIDSNAEQKRDTAETHKKLDGVAVDARAAHILGNQEKTDGIQRELKRSRVQLVQIYENVRLTKLLNQEPSVEALAAIEAIKSDIEDYEQQLDDRLAPPPAAGT